MAPLEELDDSIKDSVFGMGPVLLCRCSIPITDIKGLYLYPCPNTTPGRLRVQYLMSKLMLRRQCPSRTHHQFVPSLYWATSSRIPENFLLKEQTVHLPNDSALPTASILYRILWENVFFAERYFVTKLGPQVSPFPVPIFGVNRRFSLHTTWKPQIGHTAFVTGPWRPLHPPTSVMVVVWHPLLISAPGRPRGWPSQRPLPMWTSGNLLLKRQLHEFFVTYVK
jgi:hypothetical protein